MSIGGIFLYKSYAYYENEKEYNVIKGIIPDFSYDVKFAINVDGEKKDNIPESAIGKENKYYEVTATCDEGIKAEWDYNAWNLKVDNITKGTKCTLAFNSKLSEEDYKEYIEAGVAYRRNTYRGKDITSKLTDKSLFSEIKSGHFDDIFVGDYITSTTKDASGQPIIWLIADLDNYLYTGGNSFYTEDNSNKLTKHHATIIPARPLKDAKMNSTDTTKGGYMGSEMVGYVVGSDGKATTTKNNGTLDTIYNTYISKDFNNNNIIPYWNMLCNYVNDKTDAIFTGEEAYVGACGYWQGVNNRKLDLMDEVNVLGMSAASSSAVDAGIDIQQYALFKLKPEFIFSYKGNEFNYWLKDVSASVLFAYVSSGGFVGGWPAGTSLGVRPRFLID